MPHAIWEGTISFGLVTIPVELHSATAKNEIAFHLLDSRDMAPVRNVRVNGVTGEQVPWESIVKGHERADGRWVTMTDEDFAAANVRATRTIDVLGAVCEEDIGDEFFDTPYYLAPEQAGRKAYALLREALRSAEGLERPGAEVIDIMDLLKRSIEDARKAGQGGGTGGLREQAAG